MTNEPSEQVRLAIAQSELEARRSVSERRFMEELLNRFFGRLDTVQKRQDRMAYVMLAVIALQSFSTVGQLAIAWFQYLRS